ncbi:Exodeoxyribonuclease V alpha chain [Pseudonocardia sp. Ae168_Ps1]|uniref:exodeoxyribonuclease V subunit alpha n=1 Tax=unclassified Pseudonocardia TaxID=2619320 RepID=UPI00094AF920|nr:MULTISPECIES: exodeoxyribonuclease V subunit alpha [unclassified Pseudonocardia]OLL72763.1 Exodeoxyribonuclease V alpha chain [Pseudonocardia sp. Ae150A_Ps1]OLL78736.1 Exodeoxyribonuclease V alpha chain [Pseudonocardia sp. Ae168_Ps1]OLL87136.1 Exodeoxyribonuclease V alpha chain [Pseudonocardia sp. Ae263_Ps1]OLL92834.1 Exodeoxyribonuclease V alpha chain [Pseudonocardia sp. Ae356_Ps1]
MTVPTSPATTTTAAAPERDPLGPRAARTASGVLAEFNVADVLAPGDLHVARRLARLGGRGDPTGVADGAAAEPVPVLLAAALAVRAIRNGSVCVDLSAAATSTASEGEIAVDVSGLPWPEPAAWRAELAASPLVADGADAPADRPLRLLGDLLYLERYWQEEELVRREFAARSGPVTEVVPERLCAALDRLLGRPGAERQRLAAAVAALRPVTVIAGGPGTGKTTTVARLLAVLHDLHGGSTQGRPGLRVALAAPTGKAAARLTQSVTEAAGELSEDDRKAITGTTASTLHRLLGSRGSSGRFRHHRGNRLPHDVVVVDETSMVSLTMMARLLEAVRPDARLVLVGDPEQLASVEAGAVLGDLAAAGGRPEPALQEALERCGAFRADRPIPAATAEPDVGPGEPGEPVVVRNGVVELQRNWRFGGLIADFAAAVQAGDGDAAAALLSRDSGELTFVDADPAEVPAAALDPLRSEVVGSATGLIDAADGGDVDRALEVLDEHRVLCGHRRGPYGVARWTTEIERWISTARPGYDAEAPWYPGRPLLVTTNDYDLGLFNGDTGVVVRTPEGRRAVFPTDGRPQEFEPARLGGVGTVYAMTVHRSQGSQFDRITVVLPPADSPLMTRELLYTAVTRARRHVRIIGTEAAVRAAIARPAGRASGLRNRLGATDGA